MDKEENISLSASTSTTKEVTTCGSKIKNRGKKRKRQDSDSDTEYDDILPDNALEVEKNLHASAIKNNLDDVSVKKILKKVVTNDHVLALVKLREEEENSACQEKNPQPKLTRAKAKELMRASPKSAPWNLELTPIKHIPVKTRPEVEALITKELPDDEDDDEYQPTHDDVPSDDDQTLESCSDFDSQPPTPVTPSSHVLVSPHVVRDGPFKVPQGLSTPTRRKVIVEEEEATIARRTRSKINLSATPIEHIESSFVPPDDVPTPIGDDLWNQFLEECLNPAEVSRHEDDDEADPEYNVAADPDANDEDEEALESTIIKISKKELNDLVTELFSIMPADDELAENLAKNVLTDINPTELSSQWEGKQEPTSDDENLNSIKTKSECLSIHRRSVRVSIGKSETEDLDYVDTTVVCERDSSVQEQGRNNPARQSVASSKKVVNISVEEQNLSVQPPRDAQLVPPPLLRSISAKDNTQNMEVTIDGSVKVSTEQLLILQQQLRQHIQLATSNFLQLYVNPAHWNLAPTYKEFLEQYNKVVESNPNSIANVCNLKPGLELIKSWEKSVSDDTPENKRMVEFIQSEAERSRRRFHQNALYVGNFPDLFMKVVANSTVFLYPYLLPPMPYRADANRKFGYRKCEDELIALGLDQFWQYIEDNPDLFKRPKGLPAQNRWGLVTACSLVCKYMFPWISPKLLRCHIAKARKAKDNPIEKFFKKREIKPVTHKLLSYNPKLTLYEQPEHEMPRIWVRYLAQTSHRFRSYLYSRCNSSMEPEGVPVTNNVQLPIKNPLPSDFTQEITKNRIYKDSTTTKDTTLAQNNTVVAQTPNMNKVHETWTLGNVSNIFNNRTQGPVLTINPITSTNISNIISAYSVNKEKNTTVKEKVAISADAKNSEEIKTKASNSKLIGKLVPICVSKLTDPTKIASLTTTTAPNYKPADLQHKLTSPGDTSLVFARNMYQVVQTNLGAYLMPLAEIQNTNTVNSINAPISSTKDTSIIGNDLPEGSRNTTLINSVMDTTEELKNHCKCCILLRKICKVKQTRITDFFKPKNNLEKKCECSNREYPKITKRLRSLLNNYKSKSWCEERKLHNALMEPIIQRKKQTEDQKDDVKDPDDLEDLAYVAAFQIKLIQRAAIARNIYIKKKVDTIFSKFDPDNGDPVSLANNLSDVFGVDLVDLYKEFLGFLTAIQADKIGFFKDYFIQSCIGDLVKKVQIEIQNKEKRQVLLNHLNTIFTDNISSSCEMCFGILTKLTENPKLAKYVFSLFPHRVSGKERDRCKRMITRSQTKPAPQSSEVPGPQQMKELSTDHNQPQHIDQKDTDQDMEEPADLTICDDQIRDCEADHSSSVEDNLKADADDKSDDLKQAENVKNEESNSNQENTTTNKTEFQDFSESTVMSPLVMSEDEPMKTENPEWKRDEDKRILEILLQYLTPEERKDKTILEILDEKNVYRILAEELSHKSYNDVKDRVMYLLEMLVRSE